MRMREALDQLATAALRRVAAVHGLPHAEATTRSELADRLVERLSDSSYLDEELTRLDDGQRAALVAMRSNDGEMRGFLIERDYPGAADALIERGLLFRTFAVSGPRRGEVFSVPEEILALLPAPPASEAPPITSTAPAER